MSKIWSNMLGSWRGIEQASKKHQLCETLSRSELTALKRLTKGIGRAVSKFDFTHLLAQYPTRFHFRHVVFRKSPYPDSCKLRPRKTLRGLRATKSRFFPIESYDCATVEIVARRCAGLS
jgi:hypothetical protein